MALRDDIGPLTPPLEVKETNKETKETKEKVEEGEESPRKEKKKEKYEWKGGALPEIPRGTLQTIFKHEPYDEVSRLGLKESTQILFRRTFKEGTGVLVVDQVDYFIYLFVFRIFILYLVSCILYLVSCILYLVSCILYLCLCSYFYFHNSFSISLFISISHPLPRSSQKAQDAKEASYQEIF